MKKEKVKMTNNVFVYVCDWDNGEPIYAVANHLNEIPEDCDGQDVGLYTLDRVEKFHIRRELGKV